MSHSLGIFSLKLTFKKRGGPNKYFSRMEFKTDHSEYSEITTDSILITEGEVQIYIYAYCTCTNAFSKLK